MSITPEVEAEIKAFVAERDEMLMACDIDRMLAFHAKHSPNGPSFSSREVAEISLHKARTGAKSLPIEARKLSKQWLSERGYTSLDDGELTNKD